MRKFLLNMLAPLRVRDFRLLFSGQMISTLGDTFYAVALPWLILSGGHSAQDLGLVLACYGVPRVGTLLVGGALSDRMGPRRVMLLSDCARALLTGLLVVLTLSGSPVVWQLCAIAVPLGGCAGLFLPAYYAMSPEVLPGEALQAGNALNSSTIQLAIFLGSGLAGIVVARFNTTIAFAFDALTFVVSAITLANMQRQPLPAASAETTRETDEHVSLHSTEATLWQVVRSWRLFQVAFLVVIFGNFLFYGMFEVALPTLARNQFAAGAGGYGLLLAVFGAGSLLGGLIAGGLGDLPRRGILLLALIITLAFLYAFVPFAGGLPGAALLVGCAGLTNGILTVLAFTLLQQQAPRHLLGRLLAILMVATLGLYPFSVALAGIISTHVGPQVLFPISGAMMLGAALFGWSQREIREL
ncbi:MAG TPA: MFS transporter [Ktedonobacteraceae bacterium]|nr:MFS transporter [Ktedonobacteraceae bacterium]